MKTEVKITDTLVCEAALINALDITADSNTLDKIKTELWCIREGINTREHIELWDITMGVMPTRDIIEWVLNSGFRSKHDQAAFLLCTMQEIS